MSEQRLRVLIVEDEALVGSCLQADLSDLNYDSVGPFDNLDASLQAAQSEKFDLALVDLNLRDEMSYAVLDALAEAKKPAAIITAFAYDDLPQRFALLPVLLKPYSVPALRQTIELLALLRTVASEAPAALSEGH